MLWICDDCTTAYSPGAPRCPHCGSTSHHDQGDNDVAKITHAKGATQGPPDEPEPAEPETAEEDSPASDTPAPSAPKSDWVAHAETLGAPDDVLSSTKADIQDWVAASGI